MCMKTKFLNFLVIGLSLGGLLFATPVVALSAPPSTLLADSTAAPSGSKTPAANAPTPAPPSSLKSDACAGLNAVDSTQSCGDASNNAVTNVVKAIVNILSVIVGIAAVIVVIIAGFKYITSAGDASKITSAKTTLVYAIVGLVVVVLAQAIVHFTINSATTATTGPACPTGQSLAKDGVTCVVDKTKP